MTRHGSPLLALLLLGSLSLTGCAGRRGPIEAPPGGSLAALYRAELAQPRERSRRFRLLLFAEPPDRIHGEVLSALGSTVAILDGGGGRLSLTRVREGRAYVGEAAPEIFERLIGIPLTLEELVRGLLEGETPTGGATLRREPAGRRGLPDALEIAADGTVLRLERKRWQPVADPAGLGTGSPPAGVERRSIDELTGELVDPQEPPR